MKRALVLSLLGCVVAASGSATEPVQPVGDEAALGPERIVFHTVAGDLTFGLFANAAPQTVAQFRALVRAGIYDGTTFARMIPGFVAQVSTARDRTTPLTAAQTALLHPLALEASPLRHARGVLSLAHPDGDLNGGESSFCILLGPAPQLDGKYTVFGRLLEGEAVLDALLAVPRDGQRPTTRLTIERAALFDSPQDWARVARAPAHLPIGALAAKADPARDPLLTAGLLAIFALAAASGLLRDHLPARVTRSLSLLAMLVAGFLLLVLQLPRGQQQPWLACALFFGLVGVFKALGRFEAAPHF